MTSMLIPEDVQPHPLSPLCSPVEGHSDRGPWLDLLARSDGGLGQRRHRLRGFRGLRGLNRHLAALQGGPVLFHLEDGTAPHR